MALNDTGLIEFIETLRENRCLWDPSDASYTNRAMRKPAQTALLNIFQKYDPNANMANVRRKIDSLRASYQRERRKVEISENVSSTSDTVYVPTLWYYDHLNFLSEACKVSKSGSHSPDSLGQPFLEDDEEEKQEVCQTGDDVIGFQPPPPKALKRKRVIAQNQLTATPRLAKTLEKGSMDSWEAFGLSVGGDLRHLEGKQQTIAQKLISDVIFFAKMGQLSEGSSVGDIPLRLVSSSPSASSITSPIRPGCSTSGPHSPYQEMPPTIQQTTFSDPSKYSLLKDCQPDRKYYFSKPQILGNDLMNVPTAQQEQEHAQDLQEVMNES